MPAKKKRVNNKSTGRKTGKGSTQAKFNARPAEKKRRAQRNKVRRKAIRNGTAKKGDNTDVHHIGAGKKGSLAKKKTKVISRSKNRAMKPKGFKGGAKKKRGRRR